MSQQSKITLQQNINTALADNSVGSISAADVRSSMINITDSLLFNTEDQGITGSIEVTGAVTASTLSGSFIGDGSNLTNITTEWDGSHNGDGNITGSLTISGASNDIIIEDGTLNFGLQEAISQASLPSGDAIVVAGAVYVNAAQQVGIGTVNINHKLEVNGTVNIASDLKVTGSTIVNDITGSTFTGSFSGDGSGLTGVTGEWDGSHIGDAVVTGSLTLTGSVFIDLEDNANISHRISGKNTTAKYIKTAYDSTKTKYVTDYAHDTDRTFVEANLIQLVGGTNLRGLKVQNDNTVTGLESEDFSSTNKTVLEFEGGTINSNSTVTIPKDETGTLALKLKGYTVASLPTGTVGDRAYVTDATAPSFLTLVTGGGAVTCPVFHNGTNWICG